MRLGDGVMKPRRRGRNGNDRNEIEQQFQSGGCSVGFVYVSGI